MLKQLLAIAVLMIFFSQDVALAAGDSEVPMLRYQVSMAENGLMSPLSLDHRRIMVATCDEVMLKTCKEDCNVNYKGCITGHDDKQPCATLQKTCHRNCAKIAECK